MIPATRFLAAIAFQLAAQLAVQLEAGTAQAAGLQALAVPADARGPALAGAVWSPCAEAPGSVAIGPITLPGTPDCPIPDGRKPLVVISHGAAGIFAGHRDTAEALADAGFVVAAIDHPGDNARDFSRIGDVSVMVERPTDIQRLIDHLTGPSPLAARIDPARIGFFGFSRGGYTGLVLLGATPDWAMTGCNTLSRWCAQRGAGAEPAPLARDPRIRAAVIADPLAMFFPTDSLAAVRVPVLLWASERGSDGVTPEDTARVARGLPMGRDYRVEPGAGHFAFLAPCTPARAQARPDLCADAPGFDRAAFHRRLNAAAVTFFKDRLNVAEPGRTLE